MKVAFVGATRGMGRALARRLAERGDALFLLGEIVCDTNFAISERRIDLRRTLHAFAHLDEGRDARRRP